MTATVAATALVALALAQDTVLMRAMNAPVWGNAPILVEELRIGALDGSEEYSFGRISAVAVAKDGTMYVGDAHSHDIRVFDAEGVLLRRVGGSGEGPGEFKSLAGLSVLSAGELAVWDPLNARVSFLSSAGTYRRAFRVEIATLLLGSRPMMQSDKWDNLFVLTTVALPKPDDKVALLSWLKYSPQGSLLDSLPLAAPATEGAPWTYPTAAGERRAFPTQTISALSPCGHLVEGRNSSYSLSHPISDGQVLRIERPYAPQRVRPQERAQWEAFVSFVDRRWGIEGGRVPERKPAFRDFWIDSDCRIWVSTYREASRVNDGVDVLPGGAPVVHWMEANTFEVLSDTGEFVGEIQLPTNARPVAASGRRVWAILRGDFDEEYVVRYVIRSAAEP